MGNTPSISIPTETPETIEYPELEEFSKWEKELGFNNFFFSELTSQLKYSSFYDIGGIIPENNFESLIQKVFGYNENKIMFLFKNNKFYTEKNLGINLDKIILTLFLFTQNKIVQSSDGFVSDKAYFLFAKVTKDKNGIISRSEIDEFVKSLLDIAVNQIIQNFIKWKENHNEQVNSLYNEIIEKNFNFIEQMIMNSFPVDEDSFSFQDINERFTSMQNFLTIDFFLNGFMKNIKGITPTTTGK